MKGKATKKQQKWSELKVHLGFCKKKLGQEN